MKLSSSEADDHRRGIHPREGPISCCLLASLPNRRERGPVDKRSAKHETALYLLGLLFASVF